MCSSDLVIKYGVIGDRDLFEALEHHSGQAPADGLASLEAIGPALLREILERAKERRELRPRTNLDTVVNMLVGAYYARYLAESTIPSGFAKELVQSVWRGIAREAE